jgi:hypothetical protein
LNALTISAGTLAEVAIRAADDGSVYVCNLSGSPASRFLIFKYNGETTGVNPTVVYDSGGSSFQYRVGDYMDVRGSGASTEIVVVGTQVSAGNVNISTNFVVFRPTDSTATTFTNFSLTIPGTSPSIALAGGGVAFEGANNAIWIRDSLTQNTRHINYDPTNMTAVCDRTNTVDQSACRGLKYYKSANGVALLATLQASSTLNAVQIARVFQIPAAPTGALGLVDAKNGYFAFGAPGHGISLFSLGFVTNSPASTPTISSSGGTFVAGYGMNCSFNGSGIGTPPIKYQWICTNLTGTNILTLFTTNNIYTVTNVQTSNAGNYFFVMTNQFGSATSGVVSLTVLTNGGSSFATNLWSLAPGSRPYLTGAGTDTQRGLAYDANSNRVVVVSRVSHTNLNDNTTLEPYGVILLDANTGAEAGELDISSLLAITPPGIFPVNMCGVGDDGIVYVGNLITSGNADSYAIYSWISADPMAPITQAYLGNPLAGTGSNGRIGDSMAVRGAGTNTQILCTFRNGTNACIFTTTDGVNFTPTIIAITNMVASIGGTDPFTANSPIGLGCAFGAGNTFWGKSSSYNLRQIGFDLASGTGWVIGSYPITGTEGPLGVNNVGGYAGIIGHLELPMNLALYNINDTSQLTTTTLSDRELFALGTNSVANGNGTGAVAFDTGRGRVFSLSSNNGILALSVSKAVAAITGVPSGGAVSWSGPGILQSATDVTGPYADLTGTASPYTNTAAAKMFFRVKR